MSSHRCLKNFEARETWPQGYSEQVAQIRVLIFVSAQIVLEREFVDVGDKFFRIFVKSEFRRDSKPLFEFCSGNVGHVDVKFLEITVTLVEAKFALVTLFRRSIGYHEKVGFFAHFDFEFGHNNPPNFVFVQFIFYRIFLL